MKLNKKTLILLTVIAVLVIGLLPLLKSVITRPTLVKKPNIVIITVASLRPDHLSSYGYERIETKAIDELASEGILFENAYCSVPNSLYGYTSILSGRNGGGLISRTGDRIELDESYKSLAEYLKSAGYKTMAVIPSSSIPLGIGLEKGFDVFKTDIPRGENYVPDVRKITAEAQALLKNTKEKPLFLWIAYPAPVFPYNVPDDFLGALGDHPYERQALLMDKQVSEIMDSLDNLKMDKNTLVIFTAISGEGLNEHNELTHGTLLYNSTVKVPLIVRFPGGYLANSRVKSPVTHTDISPTVLSLPGVRATEDDMDGENLLSLIGGGKTRPVYLESTIGHYDFGWSPAAAMVVDEDKYIDLPKPELYNLKRDPHELKNIIDEEPVKAARLRSALREYITENRSSLLKSLRSGTDPKDSIGVTKYLYIKVTDPVEGIEFYNRLLSEDPENKAFKYQLALFNNQLENYEEAKSLLSEVVKNDPSFNKAWELLGVINDKEENNDKAVEFYEKALSINPDMPVSLNNLAWNYAEKGVNLNKALEYSERANKLIPGNSSFIDTLNQVQKKMRAPEPNQVAPITPAKLQNNS